MLVFAAIAFPQGAVHEILGDFPGCGRSLVVLRLPALRNSAAALLLSARLRVRPAPVQQCAPACNPCTPTQAPYIAPQTTVVPRTNPYAPSIPAAPGYGTPQPGAYVSPPPGGYSNGVANPSTSVGPALIPASRGTNKKPFASSACEGLGRSSHSCTPRRLGCGTPFTCSKHHWWQRPLPTDVLCRVVAAQARVYIAYGEK